jgi:alpha-L-rhamnosidase
MVDVKSYLVPGRNCLAVSVGNATVSSAGLIGKLVIEFEQGESMVQRIDTSWKTNISSDANWRTVDFDDSKWPATVEIAQSGDAPWGKLAAASSVTPLACPLFRKEFQVHGDVRRATMFSSALGNYRLHVNGRPVGNDCFTPDWTDYKKRVYYNTYDVTDLIRSNGRNVIGAVLAGGWYADVIGYTYRRFSYGDRPRLFAQLEIETADGAVLTIATDGTWRTTFGPYIESELLAGETYDATQEIAGWAEPGLDESSWRPVAVAGPTSAKLQAFPGVTLQETGILKPVSVTEPTPGIYIFDMGQNFAGFARLKISGLAGTKIVLRYAEALNPNGTLYTANLRTARATDTYILKGKGIEVWQPQFTYHGFRYVEVSGYPGKPPEDAITGIAVNSNIPWVGAFECSDPMVNRLHQNILWTQRANFMSVPTDCPQRDERLGWTGDAQTFVHTAAYNADVAAFFTKWLVDLEDAQRADGALPDLAPFVDEGQHGVHAWADAGTICPSAIYQFYNDKRLLEKHYGMMVRWVEYCRTDSRNLLRPAVGNGDWLAINADTPLDVLGTAYFAYSAHLTAEAARALGKRDDERKYSELFQQIKAAFNAAYVASDGRIKGQHADMLCHGLVVRLAAAGKTQYGN